MEQCLLIVKFWFHFLYQVCAPLFLVFLKVTRVYQRDILNNVMMSVFEKSCAFQEDYELENLVRESYELLGKFTWSDYLQYLGCFDLQGVNVFVGKEQRVKRDSAIVADQSCVDFVYVLLHLEKENTAALWEMIFRGTYAMAVLARMILHPDIQLKTQKTEIQKLTGPGRPTSASDLPNLLYAGFGGGTGKGSVQLWVAQNFTCLPAASTFDLFCRPLSRVC